MKYRVPKQFLIGVSATLLSSMPAVPALAQNAVIEEIVVTARKRSESLQEVPVAVSALTNEDLERQSATEFTDIALHIPNLFISEVQADPTIAGLSLRGQQQADTLLTTDSSVGVYVDGVNLPRQTGLNANMFDVERVEVLKGPQGTLYGRNTTGGAVNVIARKPDLEGLHGYVRATGGNESFTQLSAAANIPLSETVAMRIGAQKTDQDGLGSSNFNGNELMDQNELFVRASFMWDVSDRVTLLLQADHTDLDEGGAMEKLLQPGGLAVDPANTLPVTPSIVAGVRSGALSPADIPSAASPVPGPTFVPGVVAGYNELLGYTMGSSHENWADQETFVEATTGGLALSLAWELSDDMSLKSITGHRQWESDRLLDMDGSPYDILHPSLFVDAEIFSQELQINYATEQADWVFGAYYSSEEGDDGSKTIAVGPLNPTRNVTEGKVKNTSLGVYAQATYKISSRLDFTAGLRYTKEEKELENRNRLELAAVPGMVIACRVPPGNLAISSCAGDFSDAFDDPSWLVSLDYDISDTVMGYASIARSWRGGGQNLRAETDSKAAAPFAPEIATNYELGLKGDYLDSTLRANLALFVTDYEDIQRSIIVPGSASGSVVTVLTNAAEAQIFGAELEFWYSPTDAFSVFATAGYIDFEYQEFESFAQDGVSIVDRSNEDVSLPDLQASFSGRYDTPLSGNFELGVQLDYVWQDDRNLAPTSARSDVTSQEGFGRINARIDLKFGQGYTLSLWGKNLADESFLAGTTDFTGNLGHTIGVIGRPRTYGVTLSADFGDS